MFGDLTTQKRGSDDYGERRTSAAEMSGSGGGFVSGWFNSTFKGAGAGGAQKPMNQQSGENK